MRTSLIQIGVILTKSRDIFRRHFRTICKLLILTVAPILLVTIIEMAISGLFPETTVEIGKLQKDITFLQPWKSIFFILNIIATLVSSYFAIGLIRAQIKLIHGEKPTEKILFSTTREQFLHYIAAFILIFVALRIFLLLIIPPYTILIKSFEPVIAIGIMKMIFIIVWSIFVIGSCIYFFIRLQFFKFYITKGEKTISAFKKSWKITDGHEWKLFLLMISYIGIIIGVFVIWALIVWGAIGLFNVFRGTNPGIIIAILIFILTIVLVAGYLFIIVFSYTTKELSLTQAFLKLHQQED